MKVLHLIPSLFDKSGRLIGGGERYALELSRHMAKVTPTKLLSFGEQAREETIGGLEVRVIAKPWHVRGQRFNPMSFSLFRELAHAGVVHCYQQHVLASSSAAAACRLSGRRVFVTDLGGGGWDVSAYVSTDRWYHAHLHISDYSRRVYGHEDKPWAHVISGGVDTEKFSPAPIPLERGPVLFTGRLLPHKGIGDLIDALPADMSLRIIGRPYDKRFLNDLRAKAEGKQVAFDHECEDPEIVDAYRRALCIVLPSVYKTSYGETSKVPELLGQTLLEGMACGAPAICTDVASMPEIVVDGVTGFVVPPNDPFALREKLLWLREHPREAKAIGEAGRRRVLDHFVWPAVVRRCLEIYGSVH